MPSWPSRSAALPPRTYKRAPPSTPRAPFVQEPPRRRGSHESETENSMKALQKSIVAMLGGLVVISAAGCAATPVPQDLSNARAAYLRAQSGPAAQYKPDQVHEGKVALDKAEMSYLDDPADQKTKDLAYVAHRK